MADILPPLSLITTCFVNSVVIRLSGGVSQQSISEGSDGKRMRVPSGPEVFTGMPKDGCSQASELRGPTGCYDAVVEC
jgi:hypothetical protein